MQPSTTSPFEFELATAGASTLSFANKSKRNIALISYNLMSSFITFPGHRSTAVWNSSFKTILAKLENASGDNELAARILEDNPIAAPIGGLNLTALTNDQINEFILFIADLRDNAPLITESWNISNNIAQFPIDLESIIEEGEQVMHVNRS